LRTTIPSRTSGPQQRGFDFPELDPETPDLHLIVFAAQVLEPPVGEPPRQVPCLIQPRAALSVGIWNKPLGRQVRPAPVALRQERSTHEELALHAHRHRGQRPVQHAGDRIADRTANRNLGALVRGHLFPGRVASDLGGAVQVHQTPVLHHRAEALHQPRVQLFSAHHPELDLLETLRDLVKLEHDPQQRGNEHDPRHPVGLELVHQKPCILASLRAQDDQRHPDHQRLPHLRHRIAKAQGRLLAEDIAALSGPPSGAPREAVHHRPMQPHHALGTPGAPRREQDVRRRGPVGEDRRWIDGGCPGGLRGDVLEQDDPRPFDLPHPLPLRHHHARPRVLQHPDDALSRVNGFDGQIRRAGFQHRQEGRDQLLANPQAHADHRAGPDPPPPQAGGDAIRLRVQLLVGPTSILVPHRDRPGCPAHLRFDRGMNGLFVLARLADRAPLGEDLPPLVVREEVQRPHRARRICQRVLQKYGELSRQAPGRRGGEQAASALHLPTKGLPLRAQGQRDIPLHRFSSEREIRHLERSAPTPLELIGLKVEHRLEERSVAQASHRPDGLDDFFERHILVLEVLQDPRTHGSQQRLEPLAGRDHGPQRKHVDEEADLPLQLFAVAARHRRSHHHLVLIRPA
jgi:hypothetical protein